MTKTELRRMKKKELLELARSEKLRLPEKILKPELVNMLYDHFRRDKSGSGKKQSTAKKKKKRTGRKAASARKKKQSAGPGSGREKGRTPAGGTAGSYELVIGEENGRTIRQKAVSGKYYLEKESGRVILKEESRNLPEYDSTRIETLVRDPHCIFTYWEISAPDIKSMADSFGPVWNECRMVLRVYRFDQRGDRSTAFDIDIPFDTDNWYIDVEPDTRYQVGVGVISPEGIYSEISLSREVETPRESVYEHQDESWARPPHLVDRLISASGDIYFRTGTGRGTSGMPLRNISSESVSSPGKARSGSRKTRVSAELIIRGVAGEDTTISLYDNEIVPREDGTFIIRMQLPDGEVELPIKLSSNGENIEKNIVATVNTSEQSGE